MNITRKNSIGCKPIRSQYFDWVAYWCSRGQNFISDFLLLYTGSHDSPIWLINVFMDHIGQHYLSNGSKKGSTIWEGFQIDSDSLLVSANQRSKIQSEIRHSKVKWSASSRWSSSLCYPMWHSDEMTIGKTHSTLHLRMFLWWISLVDQSNFRK